MKVKLFFSIVLSLFTMAVFSQQGVGIGKTTTSATLDVAATATDGSTAEGIISPRLTGPQLTAKDAQYGTNQHSTLVYVTSPATAINGKTKNVKRPGYYFYDATANNGAGANSGLWVEFNSEAIREQFYMPSIPLPTDMYTLPDNVNYTGSNNSFTVKVFDIYKDQLSNPQAVSNITSTLRVGATAADFDYFLLYFDTTVFSSASINASGVLSYVLRSAYTQPTEKTFMNILFKRKNSN